MIKVIVLFGLLILCGCSGPKINTPELIIDESVNEDFETVAQESWMKFINNFEAFHTCIGNVTLKAGLDLDDRAYYDPVTREVTIRVPATRAILEAALSHEWAHHLEFSCEEHYALREPFLEVSGFPHDTPWHQTGLKTNLPASKWAQIPSEQYAETVVAMVLGHRAAPTNALVTRAGIELVEKWANGNLEGND